jgi:hypothetical protein
MDIFILAHGESERWTDVFSVRIRRGRHVPQFKQLLEVGGRPLPVATAQMVEYLCEYEAGIKVQPVLVARWEIRNRVEYAPAETYVYVPTILHTLNTCFKATHPDATAFLLGDVLYDPDDLVALLGDPRDLVFLGRYGPNHHTGKHTPELFGLIVRQPAYAVFLEALAGTIKKFETVGRQVKLWDLLERLSDKAMIEAAGYTDDVDNLEEYERYWPKLSELGEADYGEP